MSESDHDYFRRRFAEETSAAELSSCDRIKGVHEELAALYSERLERFLTKPRAAAQFERAARPAG